MRKDDVIAGLVWLAIGSGMLVEGFRLGLGKLQLPGVGFMPFLAGAALALCGLFMAASALLVKREATERPWAGQRGSNLLAPLAGLLVFLAILEPLGFLLATFLLQLFLLKLSDHERWIRPSLTALAIALGAWIVFSAWLKIPLPPALWVQG